MLLALSETINFQDWIAVGYTWKQSQLLSKLETNPISILYTPKSQHHALYKSSGVSHGELLLIEAFCWLVTSPITSSVSIPN
jgi:hypothetical protein